MKKTVFVLLLAIVAFCFASCKSTPKEEATETETEEVQPAEAEEAQPMETEEADTTAIPVAEEEEEGEDM